MEEDETAPFDSCVKASSFQTLTGRNPYRRIPFEFCARILETEYAGAITMRCDEKGSLQVCSPAVVDRSLHPRRANFAPRIDY